MANNNKIVANKSFVMGKVEVTQQANHLVETYARFPMLKPHQF